MFGPLCGRWGTGSTLHLIFILCITGIAVRKRIAIEVDDFARRVRFSCRHPLCQVLTVRLETTRHVQSIKNAYSSQRVLCRCALACSVLVSKIGRPQTHEADPKVAHAFATLDTLAAVERLVPRRQLLVQQALAYPEEVLCCRVEDGIAAGMRSSEQLVRVKLEFSAKSRISQMEMDNPSQTCE